MPRKKAVDKSEVPQTPQLECPVEVPAIDVVFVPTFKFNFKVKVGDTVTDIESIEYPGNESEQNSALS